LYPAVVWQLNRHHTLPTIVVAVGSLVVVIVNNGLTIKCWNQDSIVLGTWVPATVRWIKRLV
jgi:hypothetical protein